MAATALGYPYPVGTDRVMDGDDVIAALAAAIDSKCGVSAGGVVNVVFAANSVAFVTVTLPVGRFAAPPAISVTPQNASYFGVAGAATASSFACYARQYANAVLTGPVACNWIARTLG